MNYNIKKMSDVIKNMEPRMVNVMYSLVGLAVVGATVNSSACRKAKQLSEEEKRREHMRDMDSQIRANRRANKQERFRSGSTVQDSYISWMTQSNMDSINEAYNEYISSIEFE